MKSFDKELFIEPRVSVVMPTYRAAKTIGKTLESIIRQTERNWELIIIDEAGEDDGTSALIEAADDTRIRYYKNTERLGLAKSLNKGIRLARAPYIARADADDCSYPERLIKEAEYLDKHPEIAVVGSWQKHYSRQNTSIHCTDEDPEDARAHLLFYCNLCHSTVMMRRDFLLEHQLEYTDEYIQEDLILWQKVLKFGSIANIPEVLGDHYVDGNGATNRRYHRIIEQSGEIVAKTLLENLKISVSKKCYPLLRYYLPPIAFMFGRKKRQAVENLRQIIQQIWEANERIHYCDSSAMLRALYRFWSQSVTESFSIETEREIACLEDVFIVCPRKPSLRNLIRYVLVMYVPDLWSVVLRERNKKKDALDY